jgi:hypothetical protein
LYDIVSMECDTHTTLDPGTLAATAGSNPSPNVVLWEQEKEQTQELPIVANF